MHSSHDNAANSEMPPKIPSKALQVLSLRFANRIVVLDTNQDQNYKNTIGKTEVSLSEFISSLSASKSSPDNLLGKMHHLILVKHRKGCWNTKKFFRNCKNSEALFLYNGRFQKAVIILL